MKNIKLLTGILFIVALIGVTLKTHLMFGPAVATAAFAVTFFIGANALDTKWQAAARCCANDISLTGLTEILYQARDMVAREPTGFCQGVMVNGGSEGVSAGGTVKSLRTQEPTLETSYTPAMTVPAASDITTSTEELTLSLYAGASIPLKGEQFAQLAATVGTEKALVQLYKQAVRKMINAMESSVGEYAYKGASRATGTAGTTPFASNHNTINELRQILEDNGCPLDDGDLSLIINSAAGTKLRNLTQLSKANEAGNDILLRRGELLNISGFSIRTSAGVQAHTAGAGASYVINNGNIAVGSTTISVDGGTVNTTGFKAGDVITIADEPTSGKYVVKTGLTATAGDIVLNHPGLRGAIVDGKAVTIGSSYTANVGFHKSAIELAMRPPAQPPGGDAGEEIAVLVDEKTGLSFSARLYKGYGMNQIKLMAFYGIKVWKPEFVATLLG